MVTSVRDALVLDSLPLIGRYNINATDALILQSILVLMEALRTKGQALFVVTSDKRLLRAVRAEGIATCDPEVDSLDDVSRLLSA